MTSGGGGGGGGGGDEAVAAGSRDATDSLSPPGVVELREDVPLKAGAGGASGGGPRHIVVCFGVLSLAISVALLAQIYCGDLEVVPHGSVSSAAAACSSAGADALKAGGRAFDAAAVAALCLAVVAPHRISIDASGSLVYWEYRRSRWQPPTLVEWGGGAPSEARPPRLIAALAALHSRLGVLPWSRLLQPAILLARDGFNVSDTVAAASGHALTAGAHTAPRLAAYLQSLQENSSAELAAAWSGAIEIETSEAKPFAAGEWRVFAGRGAEVAVSALAAALLPPPSDPDTAEQRVIKSLLEAAEGGGWPPTPSRLSSATGLAVVDQLDTYLALTAGVSKPFGSGPESASGWVRDEPRSRLDLPPAIVVGQHVCGTRYVVGAESSAALAQGVAALLTVGAPSAVDRPRVEVLGRGRLAPETWPVATVAGAALENASAPFAAVNVVQQRADSLASHADSRTGGLANRF